MVNRYQPSLITFEELYSKIDTINNIPTTDLLEKLILELDIKHVVINNKLIASEVFINKMARVELALLRQGVIGAQECWVKVGFPSLE